MFYCTFLLCTQIVWVAAHRNSHFIWSMSDWLVLLGRRSYCFPNLFIWKRSYLFTLSFSLQVFMAVCCHYKDNCFNTSVLVRLSLKCPYPLWSCLIISFLSNLSVMGYCFFFTSLAHYPILSVLELKKTKLSFSLLSCQLGYFNYNFQVLL